MSKKRALFNRIYQLHKDDVAHFLVLQLRHASDREELFQEVWLDFYLALGRKAPENPRAYLLQIARRKVARYHDAQVDVLGSDIESIPARQQRVSLKSTLDRAIQGLTHDRREVFLLKHHLGLDYREIATVLDIPMGTVSSRLHHAIEDLKHSLQRLGLDYRIGEKA